MDIKVMPAPLADYQKLIEADFPDFAVGNIEYLGSGWDNAAVLVNKHYVFRFPRGLFDKSERVKTEEIEKEVNILNYLSGKTSFGTPKPDFVAPGFRYFGYRLVSGVLWDHLKGDQFSDELLRSWVETRSEISRSVKVADCPPLKIPRYQTDKNVSLVNEYILGPLADPRIKEMTKNATAYVLDKLKDDNNWVFIHQDLQMSNCLINPNEPRISGVIDWGEAEIAPIEAEFYFWSKWGNSLLEKVADLQAKFDGSKIDVQLARSIHQVYIVADYVDFTKRGFIQAARHKWDQIEQYLRDGPS